MENGTQIGRGSGSFVTFQNQNYLLTSLHVALESCFLQLIIITYNLQFQINQKKDIILLKMRTINQINNSLILHFTMI